MCLVNAEKISLSKDKVVWKILCELTGKEREAMKTDSFYSSPIYAYPWKEGTMETAVGNISKSTYGDIEGGCFHSYEHFEDALIDMNLLPFSQYGRLVVGMFVIPALCRSVYKGEYGCDACYASKNLKFTGTTIGVTPEITGALKRLMSYGKKGLWDISDREMKNVENTRKEDVETYLAMRKEIKNMIRKWKKTNK